MPAVKYYPTESMLTEAAPSSGSDYGGDLAEYDRVWTSQYVDTGGWDAIHDPLHTAETRYADSDVHSSSTWSGKGLAGASDYSFGNYLDSWVAVKPGAPDIEGVELPDDQGGFAGDCASQRETFKNTERGWECTGSVSNWKQAVLIPDIQINTDSSGQQTVETGPTFMPYIARQKASTDVTDLGNGDYRSYQEAKEDVLSDVTDVEDAPSLTGLAVTCYTDEYNHKDQVDPDNPGKGFTSDGGNYPDTNNIFREAVDLSGVTPSAPIPMTGELTLGPGETYTCNWGYLDTSGGDYITDQGSVVNLADLKKTQKTQEGKIWNAFNDKYPAIRQDYQLKKKDDEEAKYSNAASSWNWRLN